MTRRQAEVFEFIKDYIDAKGYSPTYQEIASARGLTSLATVHKHVHCLKAQGRIDLTPGFSQSIRIVKEPVSDGRFEFEGPHHLWDKKLSCYWVRERNSK